VVRDPLDVRLSRVSYVFKRLLRANNGGQCRPKSHHGSSPWIVSRKPMSIISEAFRMRTPFFCEWILATLERKRRQFDSWQRLTSRREGHFKSKTDL
jgi:hypothetical protein